MEYRIKKIKLVAISEEKIQDSIVAKYMSKTTTSEEILKILEDIKGNGTFVCSGKESFVLPGLFVKGNPEEISFPLHEVTAKELIKYSKKAPFGKGSETIHDDNIRLVREIDASSIQFKNPEWQRLLNGIINKVKTGLGIEENGIEAHLYKLLIYEKGSFFLRHKDSEKEEGMFATLLIYLPSNHAGGQLLVEFDGKTECFDYSESGNYNLNYVSFYADCDHEVKPLISGYRVCLAYNLIQNKGYIPPATVSLETDRLVHSLGKMCTETDFPKILLLTHQYTPSNFTEDKLKLNDRPKTEAFLQAAEIAGYFAKPMLYTSYQMGELEIVGSNTRRNRGRYYNYDDYADDEDISNGKMGQIYDEHLEISHWMPGALPGLSSVDPEDVTLISSVKLNEGEPIEKEAEGYTGNAGMEMQYWYHYGAICFWPKSQHAKIWKNQKLENQLEWIAYHGKNWTEENINLVTQLLDAGLNSNGRLKTGSIFNPVADYLVVCKKEKRLERLSELYFNTHFASIDTEHWIKLLATYPTSCFTPLFHKILATGEHLEVARLLAVLSIYYKSGRGDVLWIKELLHGIPDTFKRIEISKFKGKQELVKELLTGITSLATLNESNKLWVVELTEAILLNPESEYIANIILPVLEEQREQGRILEQRMRETGRIFLEDRVKVKPEAPITWQRGYPQALLKDKRYSEQIEILIPFMESPEEEILLYRKGQSSRDSMSTLISTYKLDLNTETIRKGSPYTLRLNKTQATFQRELNQWNENTELLKRL